ncbi:hypothetical protein FRC12_015915 [Ceratobasidium sp. 428]|nr:hypothetical protein FRC12_015915 [Ceratobasidium sp. 428]
MLSSACISCPAGLILFFHSDRQYAPWRLPRGKSRVGRDDEIGEAGLFKRSNGNTPHRKQAPSAQGGPTPNLDDI